MPLPEADSRQNTTRSLPKTRSDAMEMVKPSARFINDRNLNDQVNKIYLKHDADLDECTILHVFEETCADVQAAYKRTLSRVQNKLFIAPPCKNMIETSKPTLKSEMMTMNRGCKQ
jgi:hypothetical protein